MSITRVTQLEYLELEVAEPDAWTAFATELLGLEQVESGDPEVVLLRNDAHHHRIALRAGARDDVVAMGWLVADEAALDEVVTRLASLGVEASPCTEADARAAGMTRAVRAEDPDGIATVIGHGPLPAGEPFRSPLGSLRFVAEDLGFGHVALNVASGDASERFYLEGLGLRLSDHIDLDLGDGTTIVATFLHCGPRHHSVAIVEVSATKRLHHLMVELDDPDDVGRAYDRCLDRGAPITATLGRHTNDRMTSFYVATPSGFQVEVGSGGRLVDDANWEPGRYDAAST